MFSRWISDAVQRGIAWIDGTGMTSPCLYAYHPFFHFHFLSFQHFVGVSCTALLSQEPVPLSPFLHGTSPLSPVCPSHCFPSFFYAICDCQNRLHVLGHCSFTLSSLLTFFARIGVSRLCLAPSCRSSFCDCTRTLSFHLTISPSSPSEHASCGGGTYSSIVRKMVSMCVPH